MMSQAVAGGLEIYAGCRSISWRSGNPPPPSSASASPPSPTSTSVAFKADGRRPRQVRPATSSEKVGLYCIDKAYDHGFREITSKAKPILVPEDLKGFKIRLPVAPLFIALFKHLRRVADPDSILGEVYSALQTGVVDGQENPLILIDTAKLYEVQKFCSMTNHIWVGLHVSFNNAAWKRLPSDIQAIAY